MIIFAISIIFICSLLGNIEKYWEECGVNGSKRTTPYPIVVILQVLRQVSQRYVIYDPFRS